MKESENLIGKKHLAHNFVQLISSAKERLFPDWNISFY